VVYTHHQGDLNIDHALVSRAVITATRPLSLESVPEVYAFEVPSSTEWMFGPCGGDFKANHFVEIPASWKRK